jgi:DNA repair exonuclease SbcCD ATPase subunit
VNDKRNDTQAANGYVAHATVLAEAARAADPRAVAASSDEYKLSVYWRVFGGAILSVAALGVLTVYNSVAGNIAELRGELNRLNEARADWVKKDEFNTRIATNYDRVQALQGQNNTLNATLTSYKTEMDAVKDRLARQTTDLDAVRKETAGLDGLREKLSAVSADLKSVREEAGRLRLESDRNTAYDAERKAFRDRQSEQFERLMKEVQAAVQECQVKVARLEAVQQAKPATKATTPPKEKPATAPPPAAGKETIPPPKEGGE